MCKCIMHRCLALSTSDTSLSVTDAGPCAPSVCMHEIGGQCIRKITTQVFWVLFT